MTISLVGAELYYNLVKHKKSLIAGKHPTVTFVDIIKKLCIVVNRNIIKPWKWPFEQLHDFLIKHKMRIIGKNYKKNYHLNLREIL